ncbi:MAG: putrescine-ornithine antiporter [Sutterella sp.]|nr:putrescine-ornithine antiporter [Sutterella sp.]MDY4162694.1 putrescine-ornithine antiporter [Sutterella sp.]
MSTNSKMSVTQLTLLTALNMMGSGIIMLPTKLAEVGTFSIVSWLVTATGSTALAYAFAKCGMLSRNKAGMGGYAEYAFGKSGSFMANYTYCVSLLIANIAIAISAVGYGIAFFGLELSPVQTCIATIAVLWICTVLNFKGASITGLISSFTAWGVIIPVAFLSFFGWFWFSGDLYMASWNPNNIPTFDAVSASISMTLWSFLGLESACANSEAVDNPEKNVPKAVMCATIGVAIIYILSTNVAAGIVGNADLVKSTAPFGLVFSTIFNDTAGKIVMGLMVLSCSGSLLSWQFTIARVFKSSADDGYFPRWFSKVTKDDAPVVGMLIIVSIQTLMSLMTISPSLYKQFNTLVDLAVVTNIMPYLLSMAAVFVMLKAENVAGSQIKVIKIMAVIGSIYSLYALYAAGFEAMMYGSLATFIGWTFYGFAAEHLYRKPALTA